MTEIPKPPNLDIDLADLTPSKTGDEEGSQKSRPIEEIQADLEAILRTMRELALKGEVRMDSDTTETEGHQE